MRIIRTAAVQDAEALLAIYAPYIEHTAITFEYEVPTVEEFRERIRHTLQKYPYLVVEEDGVPVGYAYASPLKNRAAYDWCVEVSIYVKEDCQRSGFGRELYQALENKLREMHIRNVYACIAYPQVEDEYLTRNSEKFHQHLGYIRIGEFHQCGYKFNRWYDMIWMEKMLGDHPEKPENVVPFGSE